MRSTITGDKFKKMIMAASHTKGYISSSAKSHLQKTTLSTGTKASTLLHNSHAHVSRTDATKIIKAMKAEGLAHGVIGSAQEYVRKAFKQEEAQKEMIKRQNVGTRSKEIAEEKAKEIATTTAKMGKTTKPMTPVRLAATSVSAVGGDLKSETPAAAKPLVSVLNDMVTPKTTPSPSAVEQNSPLTPKHSLPPAECPEELIDMAID